MPLLATWTVKLSWTESTSWRARASQFERSVGLVRSGRPITASPFRTVMLVRFASLTPSKEMPET